MSSEESQQIETLHGTVERVTFRNPNNGYSVIQVLVEQSSDRITVVGMCPHAKVGSHVAITGAFITHPKFGRQFTLSSLAETPPSTAEGIERYLSSGLIAGVGKKTAQRIVDEFGTSALDMIKSDPERVAALAGVGKKRADLLLNALTAQTEFDRIMRFMVEHNISPTLSAKIYEKYQNKAIANITANPYILARDIRGIGFRTADSIAFNLGMSPHSPRRLEAGLYYALEEASHEGHCYLTPRVLLDRARLLLGIEEAHELEEHLSTQIANGELISHGEGIFLPRYNIAEDAVARFIADRTTPQQHPALTKEAVAESIAEAQRALGVTLSPEQQVAVESAAHYPLLIITGGPGCGKTTIIKALTILFQRAALSFALAAPTGRAAQRMSQVTAAPASTIHRLLKFDPNRSNFIFNARNPLPYDVLIIDEASMVDINLAQDLFAAIQKRTILILVGDKDQLPSVGPGRVFGGLVSCADVRVVALSKLFRRADESAINSVAYTINIGEVPNIPTPDGATKSDAYFIQRDDTEEAGRLIESLVSEQIPRKFGFSGTDIAVLTPSNRGPVGTIELNKRIQERLNPLASHSTDEVLEIGDTNFRVGDRVCQRVNNYKIDPSGVFNGDMGTIYAINREQQSLTVELWDGRLIEYPRGEISQLSLAYAITVHRSQGMEVPCVVFAIDNSHFTLLERQLVYTGVTRAKKLLIMVGSKRALSIAARRAQTKRRCTLLLERITKILA